MRKTNRWLLLATVLIGPFLAVMDISTVNVAMINIRGAFGTSATTTQWVSTSYTLAMACVLLLVPWLGRQYGMKRVYCFSMLLYTLSATATGFATNFYLMVLGRVIAGLGGGCLITGSAVLWMREFPPEQRALPMGFFTVAIGAAAGLGPAVGGFLVQDYAWTDIFYIKLPLGLVGFIAPLLIVPRDEPQEHEAFDPIGFLSLTICFTALLVALSSGNAPWNTYGWTSPFLMGCYVVTGLGLIVFLIAEWRVRQPMLPLHLFKDLLFSGGCFVAIGYGIVFGQVLLLYVLFLETSLETNHLHTGLSMLPLGISLAIVSPIAGVVAGRVSLRWSCVVGLLVLAYASYRASVYTIQTSPDDVFFDLSLYGVGVGILLPPLQTLALSRMHGHDIGPSAGAFQAFRTLGVSFGIALSQTLLVRRQIYHDAIYGQRAIDYFAPIAQVERSLERHVHAVDGFAGPQALERAHALMTRHVRLEGWIGALNDDFFLGIIVCFACIIPLLFLRVRILEKS